MRIKHNINLNNKFNTFFKKYSKNVDNADQLFFWKLSDDIVLKILKEYINVNSAIDTVILDAGGGTGRWIVKLMSDYNTKFILYDKSSAMLDKAKRKNELRTIKDKISYIEGDLENMKAIEDETIDYVVSIYNPISFVSDVQKVFDEFYRILKKGGKGLIMGQSYYNALYSKINNYLADFKELSNLYSHYQVTWNNTVPALNVFTQETLQKFSSQSGFKFIKAYGVPILTQPQNEDFDPKNIMKSKLSKRLEQDEKFYRTVFDIEVAINSNPTLVNRGMNILAVIEK